MKSYNKSLIQKELLYLSKKIIKKFPKKGDLISNTNIEFSNLLFVKLK